MSPYGRHQFARTAGLAGVLTALTFLVMAATDEPSAGPGDRIARVAALSPVLAAVSVTLALGVARRRGELRALAACGAGPMRASLGALAAASLVGLVGAAALALGAGRIEALLPASASSPWHTAGSVFSAAPLGVSWDGSFAHFTEALALPASPLPRLGVAGSVGATALVLPFWVAAPLGRASRVTVGTIAAGLAVVGFHAVAVGGSPATLAGPAILLLAHVGAAHVLHLHYRHAL